MEILFVRTDPVQEIAADPATLDLLKDILRPKDDEPRASPEFLAAARLSGWPLVYDATLRPGVVHCRPTPGAPSLSVEVLAEWIAEWMRTVPPKEQTNA